MFTLLCFNLMENVVIILGSKCPVSILRTTRNGFVRTQSIFCPIQYVIFSAESLEKTAQVLSLLKRFWVWMRDRRPAFSLNSLLWSKWTLVQPMSVDAPSSYTKVWDGVNGAENSCDSNRISSFFPYSLGHLAGPNCHSLIWTTDNSFSLFLILIRSNRTFLVMQPHLSFQLTLTFWIFPRSFVLLLARESNTTLSEWSVFTSVPLQQVQWISTHSSRS